MMDMSKLFLTVGIVFIVMGLLWRFIGKIPGDILIKKGNVTFYFPIVTSIVLSVVISLILYILSKFR
ncbi:DUF2905 domain-containing protein [Ectobacillus antri]|uniref:DUF2905 domain-containing protein n=1 Tax=Ectobacillus antri TaxID=2486280 RepID=A0ABT6H174_9BACI|nr:DUF2905 domain-containing protein [Ectobacillus antri]MDG4655393.1 DUF2905 domain-containing protein [Ectobacillus antri]MDG5753151.1 DUF2905 domain-containing protein [Ectobacillus antri]